MKATLKHVVIKAVGWLFILLGLIGLFLPFLQGILFILIGLSILSAEYVWAHQLLAYLRTRFPKLHHQVHKATQWVGRWRPGEKKDSDEGKHGKNPAKQVVEVAATRDK